MPIQDKDLGKYKRPAIYTVEDDNSTVDTPVDNSIVNLVVGFSKKGPINNPTKVSSKTEFKSIFGDVDVQLENKGSFFHSSVLKMLDNGPVYALNLLKTQPDRDVLNYVSLSTTASYDNSDITNQYTADYERFFNRQDFWKRDSESFLDVVNDTTTDTKHLLHLTNMGDKTISVFIFKSTTTGFDVSASDWYGGDTKVPQYIHPKSWISDFLVTVLVISGDWSNYNTLSVDSTWGKYFTTDGLITSKVQDFVNERTVTTLASYDVSLIPNFKDVNKNDMFIENVINNNTNKTNLFCTYNKDLLLDNDYLSNLMDLVGDTLVGTDKGTVNFLSYNQTIKETKTYNVNTVYDEANNVFGTIDRGAFTCSNINWRTSNISWSLYDTATNVARYNTNGGKYIINGVTYSVSTSQVDIPLTAIEDGYKRVDVLYADADGFHAMEGITVGYGEAVKYADISFNEENVIILGYLLLSNATGTANTVTGTYQEISVNSSGFVNPRLRVTAVTAVDEPYINIEFLSTSGATYMENDYLRLNQMKYYNELAQQLASNTGLVINATGTLRTPIINPNFVSYTTTSNAMARIYVASPSSYITSNAILIYYTDNIFNITAGATTLKTVYNTATNVVGKNSTFYTDYVAGEINNGDYFIIGDVKYHLVMSLDSTGVLTVGLEDDATFPSMTSLVVNTDLGNWRQTVEIENVSEITDLTNVNSIKVDKTRYSEVKRGMFLEAYYDEAYYSAGGDGYNNGDITPKKLTRITSIKNDSTNSSYKILYTDMPIKMNNGYGGEYYTTVYPAVYDYITNLKSITLKPFKIHADSIPNGTETRLTEILDLIGSGTNLYKGLVSRNKIDWRYLIDSFGLGLTENSKQQYVDLCGKKLNCLGFINMPSAKQFKKSSNPSFVDDNGALSIEYVKAGANEDKNPDFLYSFGNGTGQSTVGYFFPYVKATVSGVSKILPPAAYVASAFMRKLNSNVSGVYPFTICAGIGLGLMNDISGTEIDFSDDDLLALTEMGANPIRYVKNVGYIIDNDSTAQVFPVSSLSYLHSRELLIELENELYQMLLRYQWKFNTPENRSEIKHRADKICQQYVDAAGLYAFKNVITTDNNTNYIIDLQGGCLDTHVEITKGMGWIVNNIIVEKTGAISSSGFNS